MNFPVRQKSHLVIGVISHYLCHILLVRNKSLHQLHTQERYTWGMSTRRWGLLGTFLKIYHTLCENWKTKEKGSLKLPVIERTISNHKTFHVLLYFSQKTFLQLDEQWFLTRSDVASQETLAVLADMCRCRLEDKARRAAEYPTVYETTIPRCLPLPQPSKMMYPVQMSVWPKFRNPGLESLAFCQASCLNGSDG